jgi:hypothetical protein
MNHIHVILNVNVGGTYSYHYSLTGRNGPLTGQCNDGGPARELKAPIAVKQ